MSRWPGRLITKNPVTPSGPAPTSSAPGVWTLPEVAYWTKQGLWPSASADPYWSYVSYLMSTTATNAQQNNTFLDSSTNNFTITRVGNTTQGSATPYGTLWSNYFDGSGDYLSIPSNAAFSYGTGDFTVETWVYKAASGTGVVLDYASSGGFGFQITDTQIFAYQSAGAAFTFTYTLALNAWAHIALVRTGGNLICYVNGALVGSVACTTNFTSPSALNIGRNAGANSNFWNGYLSNLRIVKGTAVYTAAFTPPTAPLTAITNTSLLTCQSNRFKDNSTNNFAITAVGDTKVTAFSPFVLAPPGYTTTANGGSGYFDGFGDYLTAPANAAFALGSGDFTLECWAYNSEVARNVGYMGVWSTSYILYREATAYKFYYSGPGGSPLSPSIPAVANAWTHLAVVRNGSTLTFYVNGAVGASTNVGTTAISNGSTQPMYIGANQDSPFSTSVDGYMAGARLVKGTAVYTAAFTPPTTPPTAISGTSILCNFTNAGLYDAAVQNNMETVGNAQVSNAQAKYGTTSAYFDGSGDYLTLKPGAGFAFGTGSFTVETWVYPTNASGTSYNIIDARNSGQTGTWVLYRPSSNLLEWYNGSSAYTASVNIPSNQWSHVSYCRSGTTGRLFLNGTVVGTFTDSTNYSVAPTTSYIASRYTANEFLNGYIDDLRITKGVARYTANFTPPTAALPVY